MDIHWQWLNTTGTALEVRLGQAWRWDTFDRAIWKLFAYVEQGNASVTVVLNLTDLTTLPDPAYDQILQAFSQSPERLARVILVSDNPNVRDFFATHPIFTPVVNLADVKIA